MDSQIEKALEIARDYDIHWAADTTYEPVILARALLAVAGQKPAVQTFEEFGLRWTDDERSDRGVEVRDTENDARELQALIDPGTPEYSEIVCRTVTRTEWRAVTDQLPGA